jgi:WhiB family redox-sensing transcriptional regulator
MTDTIWASIKTDWHADATCGGADDYLFFPAEETETRLQKVRSLFCDHCPVREKCLNSALINGDSGYWGGTSTDMRAAMKRTRYRAKCPVCSSRSLIETGEIVTGDDGVEVFVSSYQVCLACAASWRSETPRLTLITAAPELPVEAVPS